MLLRSACVLFTALLVDATAELEVKIADAGNECPNGFDRLASVAACRAAMDLVGYDGEEYNGDENEATWPAGCYFCKNVNGCTNGFWFNEHSTGAAKNGARPVCARGLEPLSDTSILFTGDSDVDYWPTQSYAGSHNIAVGGYTCKDVLREADATLDAFDGLDWVVLVCGENDLAYGASPKKAFSRFKSIVAEVVATGARVVCLGTKPEPSTSGLWDEYRSYDAKVRAHATALAAADGPPPLVMVDVYPAFEDLGNPDSLYQNDDLHLSEEGYALWNQWARLALDDPSDQCVRWLSGACAETAGSGADGACADDPDWRRAKSAARDCDWVNSKKKRKRKRRCKKTGADGVKASVACGCACADV